MKNLHETRAEVIQYLEDKLAGKYGELTPEARKAITNRLKVTRNRPKTRNTGFYNSPAWKRIQKRRRLANASKRRNRNG